MIASLALQMVIVSVAATGAALAAEAGLRRMRLATRWTWLAALALPPLFVLASLLPPLTALLRNPTTAAMVVVPLEGFTVGTAASGGWRELVDAGVAVAWGIAVAAMLMVLLRGHLQLRRERRGWSRTSLIGGTVYASLDRGPAVGGLGRPWIVIPAWVLRLPPRELRMVLVHEGEHVRAGDPRLLAGALALLTLTPWNQISWWQLRRLRAAMEIDCDRRVLAQERDPRRYGNTLLTVAAQITPERSLGLAAFSESTHSLHSRIVAMTTRRSRWTTPVGVLLLTLSVLVGIQACGIYGPTEPTRMESAAAPPTPIVRTEPVAVPPTPGASPAPGPAPTATSPDVETTPTEPPPSADSGVRDAVEALRGGAEVEPEIEPERPRDIGGTPIFTPFTVAPNLLNRYVVGAALEREYPALLRDAGVSGRTIVWIKIDERGVLQDVQINQSSGHPALDAAAIRVARTMEFSPALNRDQVVPVWVSIPIQFQRR